MLAAADALRRLGLHRDDARPTRALLKRLAANPFITIDARSAARPPSQMLATGTCCGVQPAHIVLGLLFVLWTWFVVWRTSGGGWNADEPCIMILTFQRCNHGACTFEREEQVRRFGRVDYRYDSLRASNPSQGGSTVTMLEGQIYCVWTLCRMKSYNSIAVCPPEEAPKVEVQTQQRTCVDPEYESAPVCIGSRTRPEETRKGLAFAFGLHLLIYVGMMLYTLEPCDCSRADLFRDSCRRWLRDFAWWMMLVVVAPWMLILACWALAAVMPGEDYAGI